MQVLIGIFVLFSVVLTRRQNADKALEERSIEAFHFDTITTTWQT